MPPTYDVYMYRYSRKGRKLQRTWLHKPVSELRYGQPRLRIVHCNTDLIDQRCVLQICDPVECVQLQPCLANMKGVVGGIYAPDDVAMDAHAFITQLANLCEAYGCECCDI